MTQTNSAGRGTRRHTYGGNPEDLAREVGSLSTLGSKALKDKWRALYGVEPPRQISRAFMLRALAYRIQEKSLGGLKPATRRLLMQSAHDGAAGYTGRGAVSHREGRRGAGARMARYQPSGKRARKGIFFREASDYRSLSEVAREITGTRMVGAVVLRPQAIARGAEHGTR